MVFEHGNQLCNLLTRFQCRGILPGCVSHGAASNPRVFPSRQDGSARQGPDSHRQVGSF